MYILLKSSFWMTVMSENQFCHSWPIKMRYSAMNQSILADQSSWFASGSKRGKKSSNVSDDRVVALPLIGQEIGVFKKFDWSAQRGNIPFKIRKLKWFKPIFKHFQVV